MAAHCRPCHRTLASRPSPPPHSHTTLENMPTVCRLQHGGAHTRAAGVGLQRAGAPAAGTCAWSHRQSAPLGWRAPARLDGPQLHIKHLVLLGGEEGGGAHGRAQLRGHHDAPLAPRLHALDAQLKAWGQARRGGRRAVATVSSGGRFGRPCAPSLPASKHPTSCTLPPSRPGGRVQQTSLARSSASPGPWIPTRYEALDA